MSFYVLFPLTHSVNSVSKSILDKFEGIGVWPFKLKTNSLCHFKWICSTKCLNYNPEITIKKKLNGNCSDYLQKHHNCWSETCNLIFSDIFFRWHFQLSCSRKVVGVDLTSICSFRLFPMQFFWQSSTWAHHFNLWHISDQICHKFIDMQCYEGSKILISKIMFS